MGLFDNLKDAAKKGVGAAQQAQTSHQQHQTDKQADLKAKGIIMQLKSADKRITLYNDRVEFKNLLGSKQETLPYGQIRAVALDKHSGLAKGTAALMTGGMSLAATNKKTLIITTGAATMRLEFRAEPLSKIKEAFDIINQRVNASGQSNITVNVPSAPTGQANSIADELTKLADLKEKGILTQEEFDTKKKQLLG
jgi:hypothetical protein